MPGCPIRKSPGQSLLDGSPRLIAAFHVLLRLLAPRHPPVALTILTLLFSTYVTVKEQFVFEDENKFYPFLGRSYLKPLRLEILNSCKLSLKKSPGDFLRPDFQNFSKIFCLVPVKYIPKFCLQKFGMVGLDGLEPSTSRLSGVRSNRN